MDIKPELLIVQWPVNYQPLQFWVYLSLSTESEDSASAITKMATSYQSQNLYVLIFLEMLFNGMSVCCPKNGPIF